MSKNSKNNKKNLRVFLWFLSLGAVEIVVSAFCRSSSFLRECNSFMFVSLDGTWRNLAIGEFFKDQWWVWWWSCIFRRRRRLYYGEKIAVMFGLQSSFTEGNAHRTFSGLSTETPPTYGKCKYWDSWYQYFHLRVLFIGGLKASSIW